jgi:hypothetical protein
MTVPLELDHPYWVTDGSFDPAFYRQCLQESFDDMLAAAETMLENAA